MKRLLHTAFVRHSAGILLAFLVGVSVVLPHLLWRENPLYQGIELMGQDAEEHYIARVQEIYEGNVVLGNTFLPDKDKPYLQPPLGEMIQTGVGKLLLLDAQNGIIASKFIFPFLIALTLYWLTYLLSRSRVAAITGAAGAMVGHLLLSGAGPWIDLLNGVLPVGSYTLFARPINPQISSLVMFVGLAILYRGFFLREKPRAWELVVIGILTGISAYMSPYTFSFLGLLLLLMCGWYFFRKDITRARAAFFAGVVGLLTSSQFFINYVVLRGSEGYAELAARQGLVSDHHAVISVWLIAMLALSLFLWPKIYTQARSFFVFCAVALIILTDQNLFTGVTLHPSHYHWYISKPLLSLMLGMYGAWLLALVFKEQRYIRIALASAVVFVFFYTSPLLHMSWYRDNPDPPVVAAQAYAPVIKSLQTLPKNQVVFAEPLMSPYISIYTTHDAPQSPYTIYYLNPQSFYEQTLFLQYRLLGETPESILATLMGERASVSERLYGLYYRQAFGDLAAIPDTLLSKLSERYTDFYKRPLVDILKELKITALVAPKKEVSRYNEIEDLKLFEVAGDYIIYTLR